MLLGRCIAFLRIRLLIRRIDVVVARILTKPRISLRYIRATTAVNPNQPQLNQSPIRAVTVRERFPWTEPAP
jgi:hypothetical protein